MTHRGDEVTQNVERLLRQKNKLVAALERYHDACSDNYGAWSGAEFINMFKLMLAFYNARRLLAEFKADK